MIDSNRSDVAPRLSVVMPVYNEGEFIERCLTSLIDQDFPPDLVEILVVDGLSTDMTRQIVSELSIRDPRIRMLDNPEQIAATGLNIGIREARGDVVVRTDGHSIYERDYLSTAERYLKETGADCISSQQMGTGASYFSEAAALAMSSKFGVGDSRVRYADDEGWSDTAFLGVYPRELFRRIGAFDEEESSRFRLDNAPLLKSLRLRWCAEDLDFHYRIRKHGGRIFYTPALRPRYFARSTPKALWRQQFQYGFWKVRVHQRNPRAAGPRQFVPPAFVFTLLATGIFGLVWSPLLFLFGLAAGSYAVTATAFSAKIAFRSRLKYLPALPLIFLLTHVGQGLGYLLGQIIFGDYWLRSRELDPGPI